MIDDDGSVANGKTLDLAGCAFIPLLSADGTRFAVSLARQMRIAGEQMVGDVVWKEEFEDQETARERYALLRNNAARLTEWGRTAIILGTEALTAIIEAECKAETERRDKDSQNREEEERRAKTIWLMQEEVGRYERPAIVMRMGGREGEPFLTIKLDERWERDRIYDWAQWQSGRYGEWKTHRDVHGEESLERLIMTEMLRTENAVRKAGLGSGGRRPLRFWRGDQK